MNHSQDFPAISSCFYFLLKRSISVSDGDSKVETFLCASQCTGVYSFRSFEPIGTYWWWAVGASPNKRRNGHRAVPSMTDIGLVSTATLARRAAPDNAHLRRKREWVETKKKHLATSTAFPPRFIFEPMTNRVPNGTTQSNWTGPSRT